MIQVHCTTGRISNEHFFDGEPCIEGPFVDTIFECETQEEAETLSILLEKSPNVVIAFVDDVAEEKI